MELNALLEGLSSNPGTLVLLLATIAWLVHDHYMMRQELKSMMEDSAAQTKSLDEMRHCLNQMKVDMATVKSQLETLKEINR